MLHKLLNLLLLIIFAFFLGALLLDPFDAIGNSIILVGGITFPAAMLALLLANHKSYLLHVIGSVLIFLILAAGGIVAMYLFFRPAG